jgi:hypothetical protein
MEAAGIINQTDPKSKSKTDPLSKRFSLVKVEAGDNFNRRNTLRYFGD